MFTQGKWIEHMAGGERNIVVKDEDGVITEVICRDVRHWNKDVVLAAPVMYEAIENFIKESQLSMGSWKTAEQGKAFCALLNAKDKAEGK